MASPFSAVGAAAGAQLSAHIAQQERPLKLSPPHSFYDYQHDLRKQKLQPQPKPRPNPRPLQTIQPVYHVKGKESTLLNGSPVDPNMDDVGAKDTIVTEDPSFAPIQRDPISCTCPSNWKPKEHSKALLAIWVSLTEAERSIRFSYGAPANNSDDEATGGTRTVIDLGQKLRVVEDGMRFAFPTLGLGRERLSKEWIEHVLGSEGVEPFSTSEWRND